MPHSDLNISDLHVDRGGRPVLHGVSISIAAGEVTTLLGPNGAGKSTLVLAVGGLLRPTSGQITLGETALAQFASGTDPRGRRRCRAGRPASVAESDRRRQHASRHLFAVA